MTSPTPSTPAHSGYLLPDHELNRVQALLREFDRVNLLDEAEHHNIMRHVIGSIITGMTGNIAPASDVVATIRAQVRYYREMLPQALPREEIHDAPGAGPDPVPEKHDDGQPKTDGGVSVSLRPMRVGYTSPRKVVPVYGFVEHWPHGRLVFVGADYDAKRTYRIESTD